MLQDETPTPSHPGRAIWAGSVVTPALSIAGSVLLARGTLALLFVAVSVHLSARILLPLGIAASQTRTQAIDSELRLFVFGALALLVLLRSARWRHVLVGLGAPQMVSIVCLSDLCIHLIWCALVAIPGTLLFGASALPDWGALGDSFWLASLAGILSLSRLEPRALASAFLLLAWWVPALGLPDCAPGTVFPAGIHHPPWSAGGFLPMLVPQLLALGYVGLERAQR